MGDQTQAGLAASDIPTGDWESWLQTIAGYGLSRAVDAQYSYPYRTTDPSQQLGQGSNGGYYMRGQPSGLSSAISASPLMSLALVALVVYVLLKEA